MSMYNYIIDFSITCPTCKNELNLFQTKDGNDLFFKNVSYKEVNNFYAICQCGTYIELIYDPEKERTIEDYKIKTISNE